MALVLVVDDEIQFAEALEKILSNHGLDVATASNGRQALDRIAQRTPDLILIDLMMPVMDGVELCHHLQGDPATQRIPVVVISVLYQLPRSLEGRVKHFMHKPFSTGELLRTVNLYLAD